MAHPPEQWEWGVCDVRHCVEEAHVKLDDAHYCIGHADDAVDRLFAVAALPALRELLPPLWES